jgi:hypothetical protein
MNSQNSPIADTDRESYLRWQEIAITQLGYTINLMMTLAGGLLAFVVKAKLDGSVKASGCAWHLALLCLGHSVLAAIAANITRAVDFRYTRRSVRARMKAGNNHQRLRDIADFFGAWTWYFFYFQAATLVLAVLLLACSLSRFL